MNTTQRNELLKKQVALNYRPWLHVAAGPVIAVVATLVLVIATTAVPWSALIWSTLVLNVIEYCLHRWPMHHRGSPFKATLNGHRLHHAFFSGKNAYMSEPNEEGKLDWRELYITLVPLRNAGWALALMCVVSTTVSLAWGWQNGLAFVAATFWHFALYEAAHVIAHLPENYHQRYWLVRVVGAHHIAHHRDAKHNFNVLVPATDFVVSLLLRMHARVRRAL